MKSSYFLTPDYGFYQLTHVKEFDLVLFSPGGSVVKNLPGSVEDLGSIPGSGRSPGEGNGNPTPVFLPEKSLMERSLAFCSP